MMLNRTSPRDQVVAIGLFCLALVWTATGFVLWKSKQEYLREAESRVEVQAQGLSEYALTSIQRIDELLLDVCLEFSRQGSVDSEWIDARRDQFNALSFQLSLVDQKGKIVMSSLKKIEQPIDVSDRNYFRVFQKNAKNKHLYISGPLKDRVTGLWAIQIARPLYRHGEFEGVVAVSVSPNMMTEFAAKLGFRSHSVSAVVRDSGQIIGRYPTQEMFYGRELIRRDFLNPDSPKVGHYRGFSQIDGQERLFGYSKLPKYAIVSLVGESITDVFEPYSAYFRVLITGAVLFSLVILGVFSLLYHSLREMEAMQQQLKVSKQLAEAANAAKSYFLATMSHEIRTPINGVVGMTSLLLDDSLTDSQRKKANIIASSAHALLLIVNDVLDFSKIEAGKFELEVLDFNLHQLLDEISQLYALKSHEKSLVFNKVLDDDVPQWVRGDPTRLRQVLDNLLSNALKFTSAGEVRLHVTRVGCSNDQDLVHFQVSDTGIGLSPQAQQKLFSAFEQADVSTTRKFGGTGLGLAICKQIVELMNGTIGVQANQNGGALFWFTVPLKQGQPVSTVKLAAPKRLEPVALRQRILLAEDNSTNQIIAQGMLRKLGYQDVDTAEDGLDVLEKVKNKDYDLILMDCHMPKMNGFQATEQLRAQGYVRPIIAITANAVKGDRETCLAAGMDDYIAKPLTLESLGNMLTHWFEHTVNPTV